MSGCGKVRASCGRITRQHGSHRNGLSVAGLPTSRPPDQSGPSECPLLDVALTASASATDGVPQNGHAVAEPELADRLELQPHAIREEPFSTADNRANDHLKLVDKTSP